MQRQNKATRTLDDSTVAFVSVDWGTTNLRTMLVSSSGKVIESTSSDAGLSSVQGMFKDALLSEIGNWLDRFDGIAVLMSGMIGSRSGWIDVPHVKCPISADTLASGLTIVDELDHCNGWIVPGVRGISIDGEPDLMRGEEVQVLGAIELFNDNLHNTPDLIFLPGTHNKWVELSQGVATDFSTTITGELFDILGKQSILSQSLSLGLSPDWGSYVDGLEASAGSGGVLHHLFSVRTRDLLANQAGAKGASFLSGLLIGCELRGMLADREMTKSVGIIGSRALIETYCRAFDHCGIETEVFDSDTATVAGHFQVARAAGIVPRE